MFTWNSIGIIDQQSMLNMTYEAWIRNPVTIIVALGRRSIIAGALRTPFRAFRGEVGKLANNSISGTAGREYRIQH